MKRNSSQHIHFPTHCNQRIWEILPIQLLVLLVFLPQIFPLKVQAEPQQSQHKSIQDFQSAWSQNPVQNNRLNAFGWSFQFDHTQSPPSIRRTSLHPRNQTWQDWGAFPPGEAYSAPCIAFNQLWVWSQINTQWVLHSAQLDHSRSLWKPVSTMSKFSIIEFRFDENSNPLILGVDSSGNFWLQRGDILGNGNQISWNNAYQIPESEFKRIQSEPRLLSSEFYNTFTFDKPVSFLSLAINAQGQDLLFRYRTAPHAQAPFGAWSQFIEQNTVQLDATGHFLQYHVVSKNNINMQNRLPSISLTFLNEETQSRDRVRLRGGSNGSDESSPISSNPSSAAQENPDPLQNEAESAEQKPETPPEIGTNSPNESENHPDHSADSDQTTPPNLANSPEENSPLSNETEHNNTNHAESPPPDDPTDSTSTNDAADQADSQNSPANHSQQQSDLQMSDQEQTEQDDPTLDTTPDPTLDSSTQTTSSDTDSEADISPQNPNESLAASVPLEPNQANQPSDNNIPNQTDPNNQRPESQSSSISQNQEDHDSPHNSTNENNEIGNQEKQDNPKASNTQSDLPSHTIDPQNQTAPLQSEHEGDSRDANPSEVETPLDSPTDFSPQGTAKQALESNMQFTQNQTNNSLDGKRSRSPKVHQATPTVTPSAMGRSHIGDLGDYENWTHHSGLWWLILLILLPIFLYLILRRKSKSVPISAKPDEEALTFFDSDQPLDGWERQWVINQQVQSVVIDDNNIGFLVEGKTLYLGIINEHLIPNAHQNQNTNLKKYTLDHYYPNPKLILNKSKLLILEHDDRNQAQLYLYTLFSTDKPLKGKRLNGWKKYLNSIDDFWCHGSMLWVKGSESDLHSDQQKLVRGTLSKNEIAHWQLETPDDLQNNTLITASRSLEPIIAGVPRHDVQTVWFYAQNPKGHWRPFSKMSFQGDDLYLFSDPKNMALIEFTNPGNNTFPDFAPATP